MILLFFFFALTFKFSGQAFGVYSLLLRSKECFLDLRKMGTTQKLLSKISVLLGLIIVYHLGESASSEEFWYPSSHNFEVPWELTALDFTRAMRVTLLRSAWRLVIYLWRILLRVCTQHVIICIRCSNYLFFFFLANFHTIWPFLPVLFCLHASHLCLVHTIRKSDKKYSFQSDLYDNLVHSFREPIATIHPNLSEGANAKIFFVWYENIQV